MNVLFTKHGSPRSGSWKIRGVQIANAINSNTAFVAEAISNAPIEAIRRADIVVLVKSFDAPQVDEIKRCGKPIIWDAVDCWKQPDENLLDEKSSMLLLRRKNLASGSSLTILSTKAMSKAIEDFNHQVIYHHARPGDQNPIRRTLTAIGYEGSTRYLEGGWFSAIGKEAERRGIPFIINPNRLADLDIVFSVRGGPWRGFMTENWKSNVKLANAQETGTPFIGLPEAGCRETMSGAEVWVESLSDVAGAVEMLEDGNARGRAGKRLRASAPKLEAILDGYREAFARVTA